MSNIDYDGLLNLLKRPKFLLVIFLEIFFFIIVGGGYRIFYRVPDEKQAELEIEFKAIAPLPNASLVTYSSSQKITNALVSTSYSTDTNSATIFKYYDEQLKQHGWQLQGTTSIKDWDRDLGGESADYCKDDYGAELFYVGNKAQTYALEMYWGDLGDCKQFRNNQNNITPPSP